MGSMIWPAERNSEVAVFNPKTGLLMKQYKTPTPQKLARKLVRVAAHRGWTVLGRSKFHELRDDVGSYTYNLSRVDPETGLEERRSVEVMFPIAPETFTGAM